MVGNPIRRKSSCRSTPSPRLVLAKVRTGSYLAILNSWATTVLAERLRGGMMQSRIRWQPCSRIDRSHQWQPPSVRHHATRSNVSWRVVVQTQQCRQLPRRKGIEPHLKMEAVASRIASQFSDAIEVLRKDSRQPYYLSRTRVFWTPMCRKVGFEPAWGVSCSVSIGSGV